MRCLPPTELYEGNLEGGILFLITPKNVLSKALEMGVCVHRGPVLGSTKGHSFPRLFERRDKILYVGKCYREFERYVKSPCKRAGLHRGSFGESVGVRFP